MRRVVLATSLVSRLALADPSDAPAHPIALENHQIEAQIVVEADLGTIGKPLSIAPDAWLGATDKLTIGVVHSDEAISRIADGASVCVVSSDTACAHAYHGAGVDARYAITDWIAPRVRFLVRDVSPWKPALTIGALAQWRHGRISISGDPYLQLGLANTDRGNRAALVAPVFLGLAPACRWLITLSTGYVSDLAVWRDGYHIPASLEVRVRAAAHVDFAAEAGFPSLLGPQNEVKERVGWLILAWRS